MRPTCLVAFMGFPGPAAPHFRCHFAVAKTPKVAAVTRMSSKIVPPTPVAITMKMTSLIATCKGLRIDPFAYLRDTFRRISSHPASRLAELLPDQWQAGRQPAATP